MEFNITRKQAVTVVCTLVIFAFFIRLFIGIAYQNDYDTFWYKSWAMDLQNGLFNVYARADKIDLNYPPLYLFPLFLIGQLYKWIPAISSYMPYQMFVLKLFPILFDIATIVVLYYIARKYSESAGIVAAALWAVNPSALMNASFWGQTDTVLVFLLLVTFALFDSNRPVLGAIVFTLAGLTKYQALFFLPLLLLLLFSQYRYKKALLSIAAAAGTFTIVFLPFMIGAKNIFLPFKVYLEGADTYKLTSLNAANLYTAFGLNWVGEESKLLGLIKYTHISSFFLIASLMFIVYIHQFARRKNLWVTGFVLMQCLFMLTTRMHERYQFVVLPFIFMAYFTSQNKRFLQLFSALTITTLFNQALALFSVNSEQMDGLVFPPNNFWTTRWVDYYGGILVVIAIINVGVFVWSIYECIKFSFGKDEDLEIGYKIAK